MKGQYDSVKRIDLQPSKTNNIALMSTTKQLHLRRLSVISDKAMKNRVIAVFDY